MINETISAVTNNCSITYNVVDILSHGTMDLLKNNNMLFTVFAMIGLIALISAVGEKAMQAFKYLFMFFIAIPLIIITGLINKKNRRERLKELGHIKAHLKIHKEKQKPLFIILALFLVLSILLIIVRVFII